MLQRTGHQHLSRPWAISSLERALERFADITEDERAALYALRCGLAHDFSLVTVSAHQNEDRRRQLRHFFDVDLDGDRPLITFPERRETPWNGDFNTFNPTHVNLGRLTDFVTPVRKRIYECYDTGTLRLRRSPIETRRRHIFTHGASVEQFTKQHEADDIARWRRA